MKQIFLIGMMGTGKSTVGKSLSEKLKNSFIDIDQEIEKREKITINEIFKIKGEKYFRNIESKILIECKNEIVSCGGGIILNKKNRNFLKDNGFNIHLKCSINTIIKRIENTSSRPLLNEKNLKNDLLEIKKTRMRYYKNIANITILTDYMSLDDVCNEIIQEINK